MAKRETKQDLGFNGAFKGLKEGAEAAKPPVENLGTAIDGVAESSKKASKIDPFKKMPDQAKKAKQEVESLQKSLKKIEDQLKRIARQALTINSGSAGSTPGSLSEMRRINEANREANRLAAERERIQTLQARTQRELSAAQAAAIRVTAQQEALEAARSRRAEQDARRQQRQGNQSRPYKELERQFRASQAAGQDLGAELILLQRQGRGSGEEFERLSRQYNENQEQTRRLGEEYRRLNHQLINDAPNVGNYQSAFENIESSGNKFIGFLGNLGVAIGGGAIFQGIISSITEVEDSIADLSSVTGASGKDLDFFKTNAIELGKTVKGGAAAVVEAYKLIASAKPDLLENAEALNEVTKSAILLSKASGMDLPAAATALTDAMNQFDVSADQSAKFVDILAAAAKYGSAEIPQLTDALLKFGPIAKSTNVSVRESAALIEDLAEKGLKGADAGTAIRNAMLKLSAPDALPKEAQEALKKLGVNFDDLRDKSKPFAERLDALKPLLKDNAALVKVFGLENASAATTLISTTERIKDLTDKLDENGVAQEQAEARSKTLSQAWTTFKGNLNAIILEFYNGTDAASGFTGALDYLSKNIKTIIISFLRLGEVIIIFKGRLLALKLYENVKAFIALNRSVDGASRSLLNGSEAGQRFGKALKGIGFAVAIAFAIELASKFYDIASGAERARDISEKLAKIEAFNDSRREKEGKIVGNSLDSRYSKLKNEMQLLKDSGASAREIAKKDAELRKRLSKEIASETAADNTKIFLIKQQILDAEEALRQAQESGAEGSAFQQQRILKDLYGQIQAAEKRNQVRASFLNVINPETKEFEKNTSVIGDNTKKKKENTTALKENNDELQRSLQLLSDERQLRQEIKNLQDENAIEPVRQQQEDELLNQRESIRLAGEYQIDEVERLIDIEFQMRKVAAMEQAEFDKETLLKKFQDEQLLAIDALTKERDELLKQEGLTASERAKINASYQQRIDETRADFLQKERKLALEREKIELELQNKLQGIDEERNARINKVNDELTDLLESKAEKENERIQQQAKDAQDALDKEKKLQEERRKMYVEYADAVVDELKRISDAEIGRLDERIKNEQALQQSLIEAANAGNISAQQSIAASRDAERKATVEKEREQRKQQALEEFKAFYNLVNNNLEKGDSAPAAVAKAFAQTGIIKAAAKLISAIPGFKTGTKGKVKDEMAPNISTGADPDNRLIRVAGDEMIFNANQSNIAEKAGFKTTDDIISALVNPSIKYDQIDHEQVAHRLSNNSLRVKRPQQMENAANLAVLRKLDDVKAAIENKTEFMITDVVVDGMAVGVALHEKSKGLEKYGIHVIRP